MNAVAEPLVAPPVAPARYALTAWTLVDLEGAHALIERGTLQEPSSKRWRALTLQLDRPNAGPGQYAVGFRIHDAARIADLSVRSEREAVQALMRDTGRDPTALAARLGIDGFCDADTGTLTLLNPRAASVTTRANTLPRLGHQTIAMFDTVEQVLAGEWQGMAIEVNRARAEEVVRIGLTQYGIVLTYEGDAWPGCGFKPQAWRVAQPDDAPKLAEHFDGVAPREPAAARPRLP
jgi:hypothetical protein